MKSYCGQDTVLRRSCFLSWEDLRIFVVGDFMVTISWAPSGCEGIHFTSWSLFLLWSQTLKHRLLSGEYLIFVIPASSILQSLRKGKPPTTRKLNDTSKWNQKQKHLWIYKPYLEEYLSDFKLGMTSEQLLPFFRPTRKRDKMTQYAKHDVNEIRVCLDTLLRYLQKHTGMQKNSTLRKLHAGQQGGCYQ